MAVKKKGKAASPTRKAMIDQLTENSLILQKSNIELLAGIKALVEKIDKMLNMFEEASKHVMEVGEDKRIIELADKLEELLEQNKTIAKGLVLLEKYVREKSQFESPARRSL